MNRSDEKLRKLAGILNKGNTKTSSKAIELLREEPSFQGVIGLLTSVYDSSEDFLVKKAIEGFLNDLREQAMTDEIIIELRKPWKNDTVSMLVASCWQSGLNYSEYIIEFAYIFTKGDYPTAIECLTVIEETTENLSREKKDELIEYFEKNPVPSGNEKSALSFELLSVLRR